MVHRPFEHASARRIVARRCDARGLGLARRRRARGCGRRSRRACRKSASRGAPRSSTATRSRSATTGVRLFGVDAPEGRQSCTRDGREWAAATKPLAELRRLVGARDVTCTRRDDDTYGRIVAVCRSGTTDLGRRDGALGIRRRVSPLQQRLCRRGERSARGAPRRLGRRVHGSRDVSPRRQRDAPARTQCSARSNRARRLLHQRQHQRRRRAHLSHARLAVVSTIRGIDEGKGERWFCTEDRSTRSGLARTATCLQGVRR